MKYFITGAAGFIGFHLATRLLREGHKVVGVDNLNDYYDPAIKRGRLDLLSAMQGFSFHELDIADNKTLMNVGAAAKPDIIIHLAAQAGVRYSIENPFAYASSNLLGHLSILELARAVTPRHLVYASSSSIYGANEKTPFAETDMTDSPVSLYGATKKSDELMSSSYARLYQIPQTGLRFFTVYGPWGRPDMAYWIFTAKMAKNEAIDVFNQGRMGRDFTYVEDIVDGVIAASNNPPDETRTFHQVYNLGNDNPEELMTMIALLQEALGQKTEINFKGMQKGDVERTWADITKARTELGYEPKVSLKEGLTRFAEWRRGDGARFF